MRYNQGLECDWSVVWDAANRARAAEALTTFPTLEERTKARQEIMFIEWIAELGEREQTCKQLDMFTKEIARLHDLFEDAMHGKSQWKDFWAEVKQLRAVFERTYFASERYREEVLGWIELLTIPARGCQRLLRDIHQTLAARSRQPNGLILMLAECGRPSYIKSHLDNPDMQEVVRIAGQAFFRGGPNANLGKGIGVLKAGSFLLNRGWHHYRARLRNLSKDDQQAALKALLESQRELHDAWHSWLKEQEVAYQRALREIKGTKKERLRVKLEYLTFVLARRRAHALELHQKLLNARTEHEHSRIQKWGRAERNHIEELRRRIRESWAEYDRL